MCFRRVYGRSVGAHPFKLSATVSRGNVPHVDGSHFGTRPKSVGRHRIGTPRSLSGSRNAGGELFDVGRSLSMR